MQMSGYVGIASHVKLYINNSKEKNYFRIHRYTNPKYINLWSKGWIKVKRCSQQKKIGCPFGSFCTILIPEVCVLIRREKIILRFKA